MGCALSGLSVSGSSLSYNDYDNTNTNTNISSQLCKEFLQRRPCLQCKKQKVKKGFQ